MILARKKLAIGQKSLFDSEVIVIESIFSGENATETLGPLIHGGSNISLSILEIGDIIAC